MSTYMKIDGIKGDVTTEGYEKWIALSTVNFKISRHVAMEVGRCNLRQPGKLTFTTLEIHKLVDESTIGLLKHLYAGQPIPKVQIACCHTDKSITPYVEYELGDVIVSDYDTITQTGMTVEKLQLTYQKLQTRVTPIDAEGVAARPALIGYQLAKASII